MHPMRGGSDGVNVFLFSVVFTPSLPSHHGSVWVLPVISMLLTNTVSPVQARITICLESFRGTQKEDEFGPLSVHSILSGWKRKFISYGAGGGGGGGLCGVFP